MPRLKIAVAGSGIAGLSAAWLLSRAHDVTLIEREARLGGHANTVDADTPDGRIPVDTGFIVYNTQCYPNLVALFAHLGVETARTRMGFAVSLDGGGYEYAGGKGAVGLFGQPTNLARPVHWRMIADTLRFFREADALVDGAIADDVPLGRWCADNGYSDAFVTRHILPMAAAIWSAPADAVLAFPARAFFRFFANHGLLQVRNRPEWRTVAGGSRAYVMRLAAATRAHVETANGIRRIMRSPTGVDVTTADGQTRRFDHVVLAGHADEALGALGDADADEQRILGAFRYQPNRAVLHTDSSFMPRRRAVWSSWNYMGLAATSDLCVSYWMNALQPLATRQDLFVTLNAPRAIPPSATIAAFDYAHPVFDAGALAAQRDLVTLQGARRTWFAGSYFGYGFHEDGLQAGLWVAETLGGVRRPWNVAGENDRLSLAAARVRPPIAEAAE